MRKAHFSAVTVLTLLAAGASLALAPLQSGRGSATQATQSAYLGFDRNDYPGDTNLNALRQTFSYSGYWLNNPPSENSNSWTGRRRILQAAGFGFLVIFNGRTDAQIKSAGDAAGLGGSDAAAAVSAARREGFPSATIIFLDQEEGGRLLPEQRSYLHAWLDGVNSAGFGAGVYCSAIPSKEGSGASIVTAEDIRKNAGGRQLSYWVTNDVCPPSPGCTFPKKGPSPAASGVSFAEVWQFAQSPRRPDFARGCPANYNQDRDCYPPRVDPSRRLDVDLNTATSRDPSHGRTRD